MIKAIDALDIDSPFVGTGAFMKIREESLSLQGVGNIEVQYARVAEVPAMTSNSDVRTFIGDFRLRYS